MSRYVTEHGAQAAASRTPGRHQLSEDSSRQGERKAGDRWPAGGETNPAKVQQNVGHLSRTYTVYIYIHTYMYIYIYIDNYRILYIYIYVYISLLLGEKKSRQSMAYFARDLPRSQLDPSMSSRSWGCPYSTLWLFNIAMENGPFIDGLPIINGDFPWLC